MKKRFAVIGNPIAHSLSPFIHQAFAQQFNIELTYERIQATEETFEKCVQDFFEQGGVGMNITSPFKERAFRLLDHATERCQQAKAANTLWMQAGQWYGDNTDGMGLVRDLSRHVSLANKDVLIVGAGGAARGIIGPLLATSIAQLTVTNRTLERTQALQCEFPSLNILTEGHFDIIIHATSASFSQEGFSLLTSLLKPSTFCYDLMYGRYEKTPFVQWAHQHGCESVDGLGMLIEQAAEAFFIWHQKFPEYVIPNAVRDLRSGGTVPIFGDPSLRSG